MSSASMRGLANVSQLLRNVAQAASAAQAESRRSAYVVFGGHMNNRHRDPRWKKHRDNQTVRVKLPEYEEARKDQSKLQPDEIRTMMKEKGIVPGRSWVEKPIFMATTGTIIEPYIPPEGDGKASLLSGSGAVQRMRQLEKKGKSMLQLRKIRQFDEEFDVADMAQHAHDIYVKAHEALAAGDRKTLQQLVTEKCYPEIRANTAGKTLRWTLVGSLEPPRVVHLRTQDIISKENMFAQVTVRLHSQQTLAVYDRFGRLLHGSEALVKDVLEYVVFEKHLSNLHGHWRMHAKIIPEWQAVKPPQLATFVSDDTQPAAISGQDTTAAAVPLPAPPSQDSQDNAPRFATS